MWDVEGQTKIKFLSSSNKEIDEEYSTIYDEILVES